MFFHLLSSFQQNIRIISTKLPLSLQSIKQEEAYLNNQRPISALDSRQYLITPLLPLCQVELTITTPVFWFTSQEDLGVNHWRIT
jgi:hypothetical protein